MNSYCDWLLSKITLHKTDVKYEVRSATYKFQRLYKMNNIKIGPNQNIIIPLKKIPPSNYES